MHRKYPLKFVLLLCVLFLPLTGAAQSEMEDVIYFENGEVLRGEIIERDEEKGSLLIETTGRNVVLVWLDEVDQIKRERIPNHQYYKKSGYMNNSGLSILPGSGNTSVRFQMINGYQFMPRLSAGIGLGFTHYDDPLNLVPLFVDIKFKFLKANTTPFVSLKVGHNFSIHSDEEIQVDSHRGGSVISPAIGIQFETSNRFGYYFKAGYNADNARYEQELGGTQTLETALSYKRLLFGFGFSF